MKKLLPLRPSPPPFSPARFTHLSGKPLTQPSSTTNPPLTHPFHHDHHHGLSTHRTLTSSTSSSTSSSTVSVGTAYEHLCARTLRRLGFNLTRTGGRADRGIDLIGTWTVPSPFPSLSPSPAPAPDALTSTLPQTQTQTQTLRVVIQCKAHNRTPHPQWVRELEGTIGSIGSGRGAPSEYRDQETVGVLCATRAASPGLREAVRLAGRGMVWVQLLEAGHEGGEQEEEGERGQEKREEREKGGEGQVKQFLWNEAVTKAVGRGFGTGLRYKKGGGRDGGRRLTEQIVLMVDGRIWEPGDNEDKEGERGHDRRTEGKERGDEEAEGEERGGRSRIQDIN